VTVGDRAGGLSLKWPTVAGSHLTAPTAHATLPLTPGLARTPGTQDGAGACPPATSTSITVLPAEGQCTARQVGQLTRSVQERNNKQFHHQNMQADQKVWRPRTFGWRGLLWLVRALGTGQVERVVAAAQVAQVVQVLRKCVRACVRECMRVCARACVRVCMRACVHNCMRGACVRACKCACVRACVCACACTYSREGQLGRLMIS